MATYIFVTLIFIGSTLNIVTILTFVKNRHMAEPPHLPVLSMAIANCFMATIATPFGSAANARGTWPFGSVGCSWYACVNTIVGLGSMLHHTVIAAEKCFHTHWPTKESINRKAMYKIITFLWGFAILWGMFPLIGWSSYGPEGSGASCSVNWQSDDHANASYIVCLFLFFFTFPAFVIALSYTTIYYDLRKMAERSQVQWGKEASQTIEVVLAKKKVVFTAFILMASFFLAWTPYAVVSFLSAFGEAKSIPPLAATVSDIFAKSSIIYNPVVYFFRYKKFRKGIKEIFQFNKNKQPSTANPLRTPV